MYSKIASTIFVKGLSAIGSFLVVVLTARYLGTEGRGEISLFMANLTFVQLFNNIVTGPAMIYLIPRHKLTHLISASYLWTFVATTLVVTLMSVTPILNATTFIDLWLLSLLFGLLSSNLKLIQGKEFINVLNGINLLQLIVLFCTIFILFDYNKNASFNDYLYALYVSYGIGFFISTLKVIQLIDTVDFKNSMEAFLNIFKKGIIAQTGNFLNFLNTRLSYYILAFYFSDNKASLGIYAVAVSISEAVFLISYGIATVQYPAISNNTNEQYAIDTTIKLSKLCFWISLSALLFLILTPESLYTLVFGKEFNGLKEIIILLSPGIIMISMANIYWNYFGGTGKFRTNNLAEFFGLISTLCFCYISITLFGIKGAAYSSSITCCTTGLYMFWKFYTIASKPFVRLLPSFNDYKLIFHNHDEATR